VAAPADGTKKTENFYGFISRFVHPPEGPTEESLRRDQGIFSHTLNNITDNLITRIHKISQTEKMNEAHRQFGKHRMSPAHPSFRQLKDTMVEDIKAGKFKVPTLIVWGFNDPEGSYHAGLKLFEFLSANSSRVQFHAFNKSGHMPCIESPEEFNSQVVSFVTSLGA
jgi:pimeloyl-ACP methyl ester carboxylesterase